jgi:hypothetical protein
MKMFTVTTACGSIEMYTDVKVHPSSGNLIIDNYEYQKEDDDWVMIFGARRRAFDNLPLAIEYAQFVLDTEIETLQENIDDLKAQRLALDLLKEENFLNASK